MRVPDVDSAFARAQDAGARVLCEPATHEYGERTCMLEDVGDHRWELSQTLRDVAPKEWGGETVAPGEARTPQVTDELAACPRSNVP